MIELPGGLGRRVNHDPRSRAFPFMAETLPVKPVAWRRYGAVLDQGQLGSCTGNAAAHAMNHRPLHRPFHTLHESDAVDIYSRATHIDPFSGEYPPEDTGSDGTSVARVLKERGLISEFRHVFNYVDELLQALMHGPVLIGVGFYEGMLDANDMNPHGNLMGGHEMVVNGWDGKRFRILNSWGQWGNKGHGFMSKDNLDFLLHDQGDATVLVR